jgi:hypothetical protein
MTAQSNFPLNDLVLRLAGGQRDGELIPVNTQKCFLGFEETSDHAVEQPQCAIFRGPNGAAVRSYGSNVSVNGVASTVHWLKEGDRIEFPNSMTVEVAQLGWVETACEEHDAARDEAVESDFNYCPNDSEDVDLTKCDHELGCCEDDNKLDSELEQKTEPEMFANESQSIAEYQSSNQNDSRFELIEFQIKDIQSQNSLSHQRFDRLEEQLATLFEQIDKLHSLSEGKVAYPEQEEESFITQGNPEQPAELPQSEEICLHQESADLIEPCVNDQYTDVQSSGDFYSHLDDDDEKIMRFDPESETESIEASMVNVEITDVPPELNNVAQNETDSRLSEMERVFGGDLAETDAEMTEPAVDQTADEQPLESFESPTHGPDEGSDSFADFTTETSEPPESGSLASQLLSDVISDENQIDEPEVEEVNEEPVTLAEPASQSTSSVADLLARMKAEGQWGGIPDGDEIVEPQPEPVVQTPVEPTVSAEPEGDVDDYMSQLLNRMRGGEPAAEVKTAVKKTTNEPKAEKVASEVEFVAPANPLRPDEFKPARQAQKIELSAMRELANSTSRHAVHASEKIRRKELGYVQIGIAVCSFFMAIYYFLLSSTAFMDTGFFLGMICTGIAGFLGFRFYSSIRYNEMMEAATQKGPNDKPEKVEASADPVAE